MDGLGEMSVQARIEAKRQALLEAGQLARRVGPVHCLKGYSVMFQGFRQESQDRRDIQERGCNGKGGGAGVSSGGVCIRHGRSPLPHRGPSDFDIFRPIHSIATIYHTTLKLLTRCEGTKRPRALRCYLTCF